MPIKIVFHKIDIRPIGKVKKHKRDQKLIEFAHHRSPEITVIFEKQTRQDKIERHPDHSKPGERIGHRTGMQPDHKKNTYPFGQVYKLHPSLRLNCFPSYHNFPLKRTAPHFITLLHRLDVRHTAVLKTGAVSRSIP